MKSSKTNVGRQVSSSQFGTAQPKRFLQRISGLLKILSPKRIRQHYLKQTAIQVNKQLQTFCQLKALDSTKKQSLRYLIRRSINCIVITNRTCELISIGMIFIFAALGTLHGYIDASYTAQQLFNINISQNLSGIYFLGWFIAFIILLFPIFLLTYLYPQGSVTGSKIVALWSIVILIVYIGQLYRIIWNDGNSLSGLPKDMEAVILIGVVITYMFVILGVLFVILVFYTTERWKRVLYPQAIVVNNLFKLLSILEQEPVRWATTESRHKIIKMLEESAVCVEYHLPQQLGMSNSSIKTWAYERGRETAGALRELQMWVWSRSDTLSYLTPRIATFLTHAADGNWDNIKPEMPQPPLQTRGWYIYLAEIGRITFLTVLAVAFWKLQQIIPILSGTITDAMAGTLIFMAVIRAIGMIGSGGLTQSTSFMDTINFLFSLLKRGTP